MRLPARATYAVRLMVALDHLGADEMPVQLVEVALATGISRRYLEQLALVLKNQGLLRGVAGRKGGYLLNRPAKQISMREVIAAVIGPVNLAVCVGQPGVCGRADKCECRLIWSLLGQQINQLLGRYSIADLSDHELLKQVREELQASTDPGPSTERPAGP